MPASVMMNDQTIFTALRALILLVIDGVEVIQGLGNGVPMPAGEFIAMTEIARPRLATNIRDETGGVSQHSDCQIQIDCYGENANSHAQILSTLLRDTYACDNMPSDIQPLYCDDLKQIPITNGEQQYEKRWQLIAHLQINPTVVFN